MHDETCMVEFLIPDQEKMEEIVELLEALPIAMNPQVHAEEGFENHRMMFFVTCGFKNARSRQAVVGKVVKAFPDVLVR